MERFWFDHLITARPLSRLGVASTPGRSVDLRHDDTNDSIRDAYRAAFTDARANVAAGTVSRSPPGA